GEGRLVPSGDEPRQERGVGVAARRVAAKATEVAQYAARESSSHEVLPRRRGLLYSAARTRRNPTFCRVPSSSSARAPTDYVAPRPCCPDRLSFVCCY